MKKLFTAILLSFHSLLIAASTDPVTIVDAQLEAVLRAELGIPSDTLTEGDLANLINLDLSQVSLTSLSGLEYASALESLDLSGSGLSELSTIEQLTTLESLRLANLNLSGLESLEALSGLTSLTELDLSSSQISNINDLVGLTLLTLNLAHHALL